MMSTATYPAPDGVFWPVGSVGRIVITRAHARAAVLTVALALALAFRIAALPTYGFSVDEINKVEAIGRYRVGDFTALFNAITDHTLGRNRPVHWRFYGAMVLAFPGVVAHCLRSSGRSDRRVRSLSREGLPVAADESWVIVQDEHTTFEHQLVIDQLRRRRASWQELRAGGMVAAQVFRVGAKPCAASW
jgi:hypothetical protein